MKMKAVGDKRTIICNNCGLSSVTYRVRDISFNDDSTTVNNILVGICDQCDEIVSLPKQSVPEVKAEYEKRFE